MAATLLREISKDEHERARQRSRRMYETDRISDLLTAREKGLIEGRIEGKAEGEAKGRAEGIVEGAEKIIALLKKGVPLEEIERTIM